MSIMKLYGVTFRMSTDLGHNIFHHFLCSMTRLWGTSNGGHSVVCPRDIYTCEEGRMRGIIKLLLLSHSQLALSPSPSPPPPPPPPPEERPGTHCLHMREQCVPGLYSGREGGGGAGDEANSQPTLELFGA